MESRNRTEQGQVIILLAVGIITLLGFAGLAIDGGRMYSEKRAAQGTSDTTSFTGALYLAQEDGDITQTVKDNAIAAAEQRAVDNGYHIDDVTVSITEDGIYYYVNTVIDSEIDPTIIQLVYQGPLTVSALSVARVEKLTQFALGKALFALNESACPALSFNGNVDADIDGSGIFSNSSCTDKAIYFNGSSLADIDGTIASVGGIFVGKEDSLTSEGTYPGEDYYPMPTYTPPNCAGLPTYNSKEPHDGSTTYQPGIYTNGINPKNDVFDMVPGLYCLDGDFDINTTNSTLVGNGVTFYMRGDSRVHFNGGAEITLTAPQNSEWVDASNIAWNGMLFFHDYGNTSLFNLNGNAESFFEGTIFHPDGECQINGTGSSEGMDVQVVCDTIDLIGDAELYISYNEGKQWVPPQTIDLEQ